jgi:hypothetical protein
MSVTPYIVVRLAEATHTHKNGSKAPHSENTPCSSGNSVTEGFIFGGEVIGNRLDHN